MQTKIINISSSTRWQTLQSGPASTTSAAISATTVVITSAVVANFIAIGATPTATTSSFCMPVNTVLEFAITPGHKVAVLAHSSTGHVTLST